MASTIYYGKSATEGNEQIKRVRLVNSTITENSLQEGDILIVYFTEGLNTDNPRLVLYIGDINAEISATSDQGKSIYRTGGEAAQEGDWAAGETVTFVYTSNEGIISANDNTYYWVITSHNVRASSDSYGGVLIDADDTSATSIAKTKELINTAASNNLLEYIPTFAGTSTNIGQLSLYSAGTNNNNAGTTKVNILMPSFPNIPTALSDFADKGAISLDNATRLGYFEGENFKTIINLKAINTENGSQVKDVRITAPHTVYLTTESSETNKGTVAIGKIINNNSYAVAIDDNSILASSPFFTIDWLGRIKCGDYSGNFKTIFDIFYPVGSYYETSDANFNPNTNWGGTWELETQGKVHIGAGADYTIGNTGGNTTANFTYRNTTDSHKLTISEIPAHNHVALKRKRTGVDDFLGGSTAEYGAIEATASVSNFADAKSYMTTNSGGGGGHTHDFGVTVNNLNIMQPYVIVNRWHRTA